MNSIMPAGSLSHCYSLQGHYIIHVITHTCAFPTMTSPNVRYEKGLLLYIFHLDTCISQKWSHAFKTLHTVSTAEVSVDLGPPATW